MELDLISTPNGRLLTKARAWDPSYLRLDQTEKQSENSDEGPWGIINSENEGEMARSRLY